MKIHEKLPPIARVLCYAYDGYIIGSSIPYLLSQTDEKPKDIDIVIPFDNWVKATKTISIWSDAKINKLGGFKVVDDGVIVDVWMDDVARVMMSLPSSQILQPKYRKLITSKDL